MNYEAKVADLSEAAEVRLEDADQEARANRRRRTIIVVLAIGALMAIAAWMLSGGGEEQPFAPREGAVPSVTVVSPGSSTINGVVNATGTFAARRETPVGVVGEGGRVVSVTVDRGDWVRAGQVLVSIDRSVQSEQAQSAAAQIEVARADANLAQANLDRALQLVDRGFISQADVDRLTSTRDAARARVRVAEAQYRELLARNARLNVVAPFAGLVLDRTVEPGQVVSAGTGLLTLARGGEMEFLAQVGESDLAAIRQGTVAQVTPVGTDKVFEGQIWLKDPIINEETRQGTARIALSYAPEIRPGGFGSARISSGAVVAPKLPESAILYDDEGPYVFLVNSDNVVVRRPVEVGIVTGDGITIASGLTGRERIVARAGGFLRPGDKVRPVVEGRTR
jgi:RND family efflux transporter MFP subunit